MCFIKSSSPTVSTIESPKVEVKQADASVTKKNSELRTKYLKAASNPQVGLKDYENEKHTLLGE